MKKQHERALIGGAAGAAIGIFYVFTARFEQEVCLGIHTTTPETATAADDACAKKYPTGWSVAHNPVVAALTVLAAAGAGAAVMTVGRR